MKIGNAIKICREQKGLTRTELGALASLSTSYISLLENNKRDPSISKVQSIAEAMDIPMPILLFLATDKSEIESMSSELAEKLSLLTLKLIRS